MQTHRGNNHFYRQLQILRIKSAHDYRRILVDISDLPEERLIIFVNMSASLGSRFLDQLLDRPVAFLMIKDDMRFRQ